MRAGLARPRPAVVATLAMVLVAAGVLVLRNRGGRAPAPTHDEEPAFTLLSAGSPFGSPTAPLPLLRDIPEFRLSSASGGETGRGDLLGTPWVAGFIFTSCAGACPLMMAEVSRLHGSLAADFPVRFVMITVDPEHDTPEVLRDYAERFGATGEHWRFLRGSAEAIYALARDGFQLAAGPRDTGADPAQGDGPFFHSDRLILVDAQGKVRGYYRGTEREEVDRLRRDLNRLAAGA